MPCDQCYNLVRDEVVDHREKLREMQRLIYTINSTDSAVLKEEDEIYRLWILTQKLHKFFYEKV